MLFAGLTLKEDKYIEFAAQQCIKMYRIFLDPESAFPMFDLLTLIALYHYIIEQKIHILNRRSP